MAENNNGYTQSQITTMQQDAMRRVNEMQRIARQKLGNTQPLPSNQPISHNPPAQNHQEQKENKEHKEHHAHHVPFKEPDPEPCEAEIVPNGFKGLLEKLNLDEEKIIVIMLLILLINEGADIMLVLALVYILL